MAVLSSQTIPAYFAIALWTHSSTRFVTGQLISSLQNMLLSLHIPPLSPLLMASMMLCALGGLNLVVPLETWSFRPVLHKDSLLRPTHPPPLMAVDQSPSCSYPRCEPIASSVADSFLNLTLCDGVMSMRSSYGTLLFMQITLL